MQRILVTGGAGFIGSHTVDFLLSQGMEVVVIDNLFTGKLTYLNLFNPQLRFVQGDVRDIKLLRHEMGRVDGVIHLAAIASVPLSLEDPLQTLKTNTEGFLSVLESIRHNHKPLRLVYASSAAVYGDEPHLPCSDESVLTAMPVSPYALEKATNERYAVMYQQLFGMQSLGLRYFNVYGERQDPKSPYSGVISKFLGAYKNHEPLTIVGDGLQSRDFIHVSDVVRANWLALNSDINGVLNIATGVPETLLNMIGYLENAGGHTAEKVHVAKRKGDILQSYAKVNKALDNLGFNYEKPLAVGISELLGYTK